MNDQNLVRCILPKQGREGAARGAWRGQMERLEGRGGGWSGMRGRGMGKYTITER